MNNSQPLDKFSIFSTRSPQHIKLERKATVPSLTAVAQAIGVAPLSSIGTIKNSSIAIYVTCLVLGIIFLPGFTSGLLLGTLWCLINISLAMLLHKISPIHEENSPYRDYIKNNPLVSMLLAPVLEEVFFRGILLPLLGSLLSCVLPLTIASIISVSIVSVLFGIIHLLNEHKKIYHQAALNTLSGIVFSVLSLNFGLGAAIGAHIINNTIACSLLQLSSSSCGTKTVENLFNPELEDSRLCLNT